MRPGLATKLRAMARADESPHEAAIAAAKLAEAGIPVEPPRPPAPPAASPSPDPWSFYSCSWTGNTISGGVFTTATHTIRFGQ